MSAASAPAAAVSRRLTVAAGVLGAAGIILSVTALVTGGGGSRFGGAYLLGFTFLWSVVLGSLFFVALHHVTGAVWSGTVRRIAEMLASPMGVVAALFLPVLVFGVFFDAFSLFSWAHHGAAEGHGHLSPSKAVYLNPVFFTFRQVLFFGLWVFFALYFVRGSLRQDSGGNGEQIRRKARRVAAPFLIIFAFTATFASFDWLMSLDPHWYSTIYGVYVFSGMTLSALAVITLLALFLRSSGVLERDSLREDHLYNLGGLLFAFTCFWAYIAFSQFMLIWYGNLPEETTFFKTRLESPWLPVTVALALVRFVVPFLLLLSRRAKVDPRMLTAVSVLVLVGQYVDLRWLIAPALGSAGAFAVWQDFGPTLFMIAVLLFSVARFVNKHSPVAAADPGFEAARRFSL